jgi:hypothetical protein
MQAMQTTDERGTDECSAEVADAGSTVTPAGHYMGEHWLATFALLALAA